MPTISVIISVHNGGKSLSRAIDSILEQTIQDFEIIICDDCSSDNTIDVITTYMKSDERIKLIKNEQNLGLALSLNRCIAEAQGVYIARMDDDDICLPSRFSSQLDFLEKHREYGFVSCNAISFDETAERGRIIRPEVPQKKDFLKGTPYIHPATMFRLEVLKSIGGYSNKEYVRRRAQDYELFMRMCSKGFSGYNIQKPLFKYYITKKSANKKRTWKNVIDEMKIRFFGFKSIGYPFYCYIYVLVPLYVLVKQKIRMFGEK